VGPQLFGLANRVPTIDGLSDYHPIPLQPKNAADENPKSLIIICD
jgi:hypothetical protein